MAAENALGWHEVGVAVWRAANSLTPLGVALLAFSGLSAWWGISELSSFTRGARPKGVAFLLLSLVPLTIVLNAVGMLDGLWGRIRGGYSYPEKLSQRAAQPLGNLCTS